MLVLALAAVGADTAPAADTVSPGIAGFLVVFVLALATVVLIRSMVGHLRKVRYSPEPDGAQGDATGATTATTSGDPVAPVAPVAPKAPGSPDGGAEPPAPR